MCVYICFYLFNCYKSNVNIYQVWSLVCCIVYTVHCTVYTIHRQIILLIFLLFSLFVYKFSVLVF